MLLMNSLTRSGRGRGDGEGGGGGEGEGQSGRGRGHGSRQSEAEGAAEGVRLQGWSEGAAPHPDNAVLVAWERHEVPASALAAVGSIDEEGAHAVGRWGESLLFMTLRELGEPVTWVNEAQEQGLPFDLILEHSPPAYIEVKSTTLKRKQLF